MCYKKQYKKSARGKKRDECVQPTHQGKMMILSTIRDKISLKPNDSAGELKCTECEKIVKARLAYS